VTKKEVMEAAFRVWGREFYNRTSLSQVARELNVSKPALYRHFRNKKALLEAMTRYFFDDFASIVQADYEKALNSEDNDERIFILIRSIAEYYARNVDLFIFSMIQLHDSRLTGFNMLEELCVRGVDMEFFHRSIQKNYLFEPMVMSLVFTTLTFYLAGFHKRRISASPGGVVISPPDEKAIRKIPVVISKIIGKGLGYTYEEIGDLDYQRLENGIAGTVGNIEDDPLLKAVTGAVAEAGPWEASMEQVARLSGLSKSSLYCHFKNRQDMLYRFFKTESLRIMHFARQGIGRSALPQEQLYLGIYSIAEYLCSKPDILMALDWIRNRRLNIHPPDGIHSPPPPELGTLFNEIDIKPLRSGESPFRGMLTEEDGSSSISLWILVLIVNTLMRKNPGQLSTAVPGSDIRILFRFLTLGIGGFKTSEK